MSLVMNNTVTIQQKDEHGACSGVGSNAPPGRGRNNRSATVSHVVASSLTLNLCDFHRFTGDSSLVAARGTRMSLSFVSSTPSPSLKRQREQAGCVHIHAKLYHTRHTQFPRFSRPHVRSPFPGLPSRAPWRDCSSLVMAAKGKACPWSFRQQASSRCRHSRSLIASMRVSWREKRRPRGYSAAPWPLAHQDAPTCKAESWSIPAHKHAFVHISAAPAPSLSKLRLSTRVSCAARWRARFSPGSPC